MYLMEYSVDIEMVVKWTKVTQSYSRQIIAVVRKGSLICRVLSGKTTLRPLLILVTKVRMRNAMRWNLHIRMEVQLEMNNKCCLRSH